MLSLAKRSISWKGEWNNLAQVIKNGAHNLFSKEPYGKSFESMSSSIMKDYVISSKQIISSKSINQFQARIIDISDW